VQLPLSQTRLFEQECPQEPQLLLSDCSLTQAPLHELYPLLQLYPHTPLPEHVGEAFDTLVVHRVADPNIPLAVQLSTLDPEHAIWPGAQTPVQVPVPVPETQVWFTQAAAVVHVPLAWQVSTPLPEQVVWPGPQTPVHEPPTHAWLLQAAAFCHVPLALHD